MATGTEIHSIFYGDLIMKKTVLASLFCVAALSACESPQQMVSQKDDHLAAAGFQLKPASTPQQIAMLKKLPSHHFIRRVHGNTVTYVYADPTVCGCLYVGNQAAYGRYLAYQQQQSLANEQQMTAEDYQDAQWNWGDWGSWGGDFGPDYGFGPGWGW